MTTTREQAVERLAAYIGGVVETFKRGKLPDDFSIDETIALGADRTGREAEQVVDALLTRLNLTVAPPPSEKDVEIARLTAQKDGAYSERDQCVALIARMAVALGYRAGLGRHTGGEWDDDWRNIVFIDLPAGQVSWHIHDSEVPLFGFLGQYEAPWDGHSTAEKYERCRHSVASRQPPPSPDTVTVLVPRALVERAMNPEHYSGEKLCPTCRERMPEAGDCDYDTGEPFGHDTNECARKALLDAVLGQVGR